MTDHDLLPNRMDRVSKTKHYIFTGVLVIVFFLLGLEWGDRRLPEFKRVEGITGIETAIDTEADFSAFWKVWNKINEKHPEASEVSDQERIYGAIAGLVESLGDPYSVYYDPEETKAFKEDIAGNFEGIGMEVDMRDGILTVVAPLKDMPAYRAGIQSGDKILKIDDTITADMSVEEAVKLIRGPKGTSVRLTISREGSTEPREITITRDTIQIPTLDTELREDGIFVIRLYSFSSNSINLFRRALREFADAKTDKLIIDLRGNPGGYLNAAVDMASWFLDGGKIVVTEDYGGKKPPEAYRSRGYDVFSDKLKLVVLIDEGSASASEILAGALRNHDKAKLVGTRSFGKGSVQEIVDITRDTVLKITVAKWLTPDGTSISDKGLTPDHVVEITEEDVKAGRDPQMDKAIAVLKNWK